MVIHSDPRTVWCRNASKIRWQAVVQHCTILYGVCEDSNDGKNFRSEYWRKLQNSDFVARQKLKAFECRKSSRGFDSIISIHHFNLYMSLAFLSCSFLSARTARLMQCESSNDSAWCPQETPNVGLSTCNGTMLPCSVDGTETWQIYLKHVIVFERACLLLYSLRLAVYIWSHIGYCKSTLTPFLSKREQSCDMLWSSFSSPFSCVPWTDLQDPAGMLRHTHTHTQETWSQVLWRRPESLILASNWRLLRTLVKLRKIVWKCIMAVEMVSCSAVLMLLGILLGRLRGSKQWKLMAYALMPFQSLNFQVLGACRGVQQCYQPCALAESNMNFCMSWSSAEMHRVTRLEIRPRCWTNDHWKGWLQRAEQSDMSPQLLGVTCWSEIQPLKCHKCPKFAAVTCDFD